MKKKRLFVIAAIFCTTLIGCGEINDGQCGLPHYQNQNQTTRNSRHIAGDTLDLARLADIYVELLEGDTIVVRGCLVQDGINEWEGTIPYSFNMYLHDYFEDFEPSYGYYGNGRIQFFANRELWLDGINNIDSMPNDTRVVVTGILHFNFFDPGPGPDYCEETSFLEILELSKE